MSGMTITSLRRRLKRVSSRVSEVELKTAMVIKGGVMKEHMVLPTVTVEGKECVQICGSRPAATAWLTNMLCGSTSSRAYAGAIANFISDCVHAVVKSKCAIDQAQSHELQAPSQGVPKCGRSMFDDDDDDDDDHDDEDAIDGRRPAKECVPV